MVESSGSLPPLTNREFERQCERARRLLSGAKTHYRKNLFERNLSIANTLRGFFPMLPQEVVLAALFHQAPKKVLGKLPEKVVKLLDDSNKLSGAPTPRELLKLMPQVQPSAVVINLASALVHLNSPSVPKREKASLGQIAMYLHAPLANSLGLRGLSQDLGNSGLRHGYPQRYAFLERVLSQREAETRDFLSRLFDKIRAHATNMGIHYETSSRPKQPYRAQTKLALKHRQFYADPNLLNDAIAARVVLHGDESNCYDLFNALRNDVDLDVDIEDDYIRHPKPTGYRSLHLTVRPTGKKHGIELQILTREMHRAAETESTLLHSVYELRRLPPDARSVLNRVARNFKEALDSSNSYGK